MKEFETPAERVGQVMDLTAGGADVVAELVGFAEVIPEGLDMLRSGGRLLEMGNVSPGHTFSYDPALLVMYAKSIVPVCYYNAATLKRSLDFLLRTRDRYPYESILSKSYPLDDIEKAFEDQDQGRVSRAAIVF